MKTCEKCCSEDIKVDVKSFEDLHNIMQVFTCLSCGFEKTDVINIQNKDEVNGK